jgi:hypothetical protein
MRNTVARGSPINTTYSSSHCAPHGTVPPLSVKPEFGVSTMTTLFDLVDSTNLDSSVALAYVAGWINGSSSSFEVLQSDGSFGGSGPTSVPFYLVSSAPTVTLDVATNGNDQLLFVVSPSPPTAGTRSSPPATSAPSSCATRMPAATTAAPAASCPSSSPMPTTASARTRTRTGHTWAPTCRRRAPPCRTARPSRSPSVPGTRPPRSSVGCLIEQGGVPRCDPFTLMTIAAARRHPSWPSSSGVAPTLGIVRSLLS